MRGSRWGGVVAGLVAMAAAAAATADEHVLGAPDGRSVVTVRTGDASAQASKQGLPIFPGVSGTNVGATGLSMLRVVIPPGGQAKAHFHKGFESAVYLIQGRVETRYGENLEESVVNVAGDFLYIPADVPHQPRNLSASEPAIAIVARTDPNEQESVETYELPGETGDDGTAKD